MNFIQKILHPFRKMQPEAQPEMIKVRMNLFALGRAVRNKHIIPFEGMMKQVREKGYVDISCLSPTGRRIVCAAGAAALYTLATRTPGATSIEESIRMLLSQGSTLLAFAVATGTFRSDTPEETLTAIRLWHGSYKDKLEALNNLYNRIDADKALWNPPTDMLPKLKGNLDILNAYAQLGRTAISPQDRTYRNQILHTILIYALFDVKIWVYSQCAAGIIPAADVHLLGFLLPGEQGGAREKKKATDYATETKVIVTNMDSIKVIIDAAGSKAAGLVSHSFPKGIHLAVIVIETADGTEIMRLTVGKVHTDLHIPEIFRGQQLIAKAAFLQHHDDVPQFGAIQPTFLMPTSTEDLHNIFEKQHEEVIASREARIAALEAENARLTAEKKQ